jgi:hypothetical protein
MSLQLYLFPVDSYISKKLLTSYTQKEKNLSVVNDYEKHKKSFILNREGKALDVVIEVPLTSNYTDKNDVKNRFDFYAKCKIKELCVIYTQLKLRIDIHFLVNNYYNQTLHDDYLECSIYVEKGEIVIKDKEGEVIENFATQVQHKKTAKQQAKLEAEARKEADKKIQEIEEENQKLGFELQELRKFVNKQTKSSI